MGKQQSQIEKFKKAARDLGADDDEGHFNKKLAKIARAKPDGALKPQRKTAKKRK